MSKQATRVLWITGLGLSLVIGTSLARDQAPVPPRSAASGNPLPATRPIVATAAPATVTFEADEPAVVPLPALGVPAKITMDFESVGQSSVPPLPKQGAPPSGPTNTRVTIIQASQHEEPATGILPAVHVEPLPPMGVPAKIIMDFGAAPEVNVPTAPMPSARSAGPANTRVTIIQASQREEPAMGIQSAVHAEPLPPIGVPAKIMDFETAPATHVPTVPKPSAPPSGPANTRVTITEAPQPDEPAKGILPALHFEPPSIAPAVEFLRSMPQRLFKRADETVGSPSPLQSQKVTGPENEAKKDTGPAVGRTTVTIEMPPHSALEPAPPAVTPGPTGPLGEWVAGSGDPLFADVGDTLLGEAPMIGRGDQNNRFNIFNNQSALVQSHIWFGYHHQVRYNPGLHLTHAAILQLTAAHQSLQEFLASQALFPQVLDRTDQDLYRVGIEYGLNPAWSVTFQAQYASEVATNATDGWSSPQFAVKRVVYQEDRGVISAVLAVEPESEVRRGQFKEDATRVYPGLLLYREIGPSLVIQGGVQLGIPFGSRHQTALGSEDRPHTLDYDISIGYWLFRHPDMLAGKSSRPGWRPFIWDDGPCILGFLPQLEITGKYVLAGAKVSSPFRLTNPDGGFPLQPDVFEYLEPRHVIDATVGGRVLFRNDLTLSGGLSFPLTGPQTSRLEAMVYLTCGF